MSHEVILPSADPSTMKFMADHWLVDISLYVRVQATLLYSARTQIPLAYCRLLVTVSRAEHLLADVKQFEVASVTLGPWRLFWRENLADR
jgi:hypothetical protein